MAYEYQPYPRWKYHRTEPAVIVQNTEEEAALGEGWENTPAAFAEEAKAAGAREAPAATTRPARRRAPKNAAQE